MTILFAGGEDADFTKIGICTVDTTTSVARRTANARCSLKVASNSVGDGWQAVFPAAQPSFWLTGRLYFGGDVYNVAAARMLALVDNATVRLALVPSGGSGQVTSALFWRLVKIDNASAQTTLVTASNAISIGVLTKIDVFVNYAVAGQVQVYLDGTKIIDYSGDVTTNSAASLSGAILGMPAASSGSTAHWSEVLAATVDTRGLSLATLPPAAAGNTFGWTGATTDVNEVTLDDATQITSPAAGQIAQSTVTSTSISGSPGIVAVVVNARAQKGGTGPQSADLMVRTGGGDYASADIALPASFGRISNVWETNPATGNAWLASDLTAAGFNVGIKSVV